MLFRSPSPLRKRRSCPRSAKTSAPFQADAAGGPWLYFCGPTNTHRTWARGSGKALWGIDPDSPEVREDVADYLGEVQAVDACVAALVAELDAAGLLGSTLVVVSGDHGMPGVPAGKCELHDHGTAVPLVARVPGGTPGRIVDDFVSLPDLAPTFLEVAGVPRPAGMTAPSLLPALLSDHGGQIDPARSFVITGRERISRLGLGAVPAAGSLRSAPGYSLPSRITNPPTGGLEAARDVDVHRRAQLTSQGDALGPVDRGTLGGDQAPDVLFVLRASGEGLHHKQILGHGHGHAHVTDRHRYRATDRLLFEA